MIELQIKYLEKQVLEGRKIEELEETLSNKATIIKGLRTQITNLKKKIEKKGENIDLKDVPASKNE